MKLLLQAIRAGLLVAATLGLLACSGPGGPTGPLSGVSDVGGDTTCTPSCHFKQCGDDGCGGSCGGCSAGQTCTAWQCVAPGEDVEPIPDATTDTDPAGDGGAGPDAEPELPDPVGSDGDSDGVDDAIDNCPAVYNPNQSDMDDDNLGDACDPDRDGDDVLNDLDCAPNNSKVHPYAKELCHDAIDNNCNGNTDEEGSWDCTDYFVDGDGDGAGDSAQKRCLCNPISPHSATIAGDCDDTNGALSPLAPEICDGVDNNCNLLIDDGCDDDGDGYCDALMTVVGTPAVCPLGGGDCYDYSPNVHPGAQEIEADDVDNDCDGTKAGEPTGGGPIPQPTCTGQCTGTSNQALLCALELCYDTSIVQGINVSSPSGASIGGAYTAVNHFGSASNDLAPFGGSSYVLLATGPATGTSHSGSLGGGSWYDPYTADGFTSYDAVEITLNLTAPPGATGFSIDYIFLSEEYEEFIGTQYNDKFYMILNGPQTTGGQNTVINFTDCSSPGSYWDFIDGNGNKQCYIAINTAFSEACPSPPTSIAGTGYSCASSPLYDSSSTGSSTGWLQTTWEIQGGESFTLTFHIHDTSDHSYDSEVILDNFRWEGGTVDSGTSSHN